MLAGRAERRVFLTCSVRARASLAPLLSEVEALLHEHGWRTRVPLRARRGISVDAADRRRLREVGYDQLDATACVVHVPAGATLRGKRLHHELARAVANGLPVLLLIATDARTRHGLEMPSPLRVREIATRTGGTVVPLLEGLHPALRDLGR